jgi:hypothetical protein
MTFSNFLKWLTGFAVLLAAILVVFYIRFLRNGEFGQKEKFALLQQVELEHRETARRAGGEPILLARTKSQPYSVLGLPAAQSKMDYVWIILDDPDGDNNSVKKIPNERHVDVSCSYLENLSAKVELTAEVMKFLKSNCHSG